MECDKKKPDDTEYKQLWLEYGEEQEINFIEKIAPKMGIGVKINPVKKREVTAIDFIINDKLTDLKKQETPFFKAQKLYGINPQYCVTFNTNDYWRYIRNYKPNELDIIYWVNWATLEMFNIRVEKMHGVWLTNLEKIKNVVDGNRAPINYYKRRRNDKRGNARASYLLDLRNMKLLACFEGPCKQ